MQGVRLVSTPARKSSGRATRGRPDSVPAMFEKSMGSESYWRQLRCGTKSHGGRDVPGQRVALGSSAEDGANARGCPILAQPMGAYSSASFCDVRAVHRTHRNLGGAYHASCASHADHAFI